MTTDVLSLIDPSPELVRPLSLTVDGGLDTERARHKVCIGQALYTYWHTFLLQAGIASIAHA